MAIAPAEGAGARGGFMFDQLFHWLDGDPARFRGAVAATVALAAALALAPAWRKRWWNSAPVFAAALFVALFSFRWTVVLDPQRHGNPDETQIIADAIAYAHDPVPFRSVDGNTAGPLSSISLMVFGRLLGRPLDLITARLFGLCCLWLLVVATWRTLAVVTDETRARVLALPAVFVLGGAFNFDLMQFNNEHPSAAALGLAGWALAPLCSATRALPRWRLVLGALLIGAAPFVKPQTAPLVLWLAGAFLVLLWRHPPTRERRRGALGAYAAAGVAPVLVLVGLCFATGVWRDVWDTFIGNNLTYVSQRHFPESQWFGAVVFLATDARTPLTVLWPALWAGGLGVVFLRALPATVRPLFWVALGGTVAAMLTVAAPGKHFTHYIFYLQQPASLLLAVVSLGLTERAARLERPAVRRCATAGAWVAWAWLVLLPVPRDHGRTLPLRYGSFGERDPAEAPAVAAVRRFSAAGEPLAVWGWSPWLYVWTQQPHASREAVTQRQIEPWGQQEYYRDRFVADLHRTRPTVFIDATGPADFSYKDRGEDGHENFPQVAHAVGIHYSLVETVRDLRLYVRRDRLPAGAVRADALPATLACANPRPAYWAGMPPGMMRVAEFGDVLHAHAPCLLVWEPAAAARRATFSFGLPRDSYRGENRTDGVRFRVFTVDAAGGERELFSRLLRPFDVEADRGLHTGEAAVPAGMKIVFETDPGPSRRNNCDWAFWKEIALAPAAAP